MARSRGIGGAAVVLALGLAGCSGGGSTNAAPRISTVPAQITAGGTTFSLNLSSYVTDPNGDPITYTVRSGGGSFSSSTYSNTFDTVGSYTVEFRVQDSTSGKTTDGSFSVTVTTANFAVVQKGDDLELLDTDTHKLLPVAGGPAVNDTYKTSLPKGQVVYERAGATTQLYVYDPNTRETYTLGNVSTHNTTYADKTSDGKVVFVQTSVSSSSDTDLYIWNPTTQLTRAIAAAGGVAEGNPIVNAADLVYYQKSSPSDVYYYDPATDESTAAANGATAEVLRGELANGAVVLTRIGGGGETDLYYFHADTGLVEIGADLSSTIQSQSKTFKGSTTDSKVVFEVSGSSTDLYIWNPSNGTSRAIATSSVDETFVVVNSLNEVVYDIETSSTDHDLAIYSYTSNASTAISPSDSTNDVYKGVLSNGDVVFLRQTGTGDDLYLYDTSGSSSSALASSSASNYAFEAVLSNDKVVYSLSGGVYVVNTTGAPSPSTVAAANATYAGATGGGDFVVQTTVSSQTDLVLWDESAGSTATISNTTGNDTFGVVTSTGEILFSRVTSSKSTADLFLWNASSGETQLTDGTVNYSAIATFTADNS